MDREKVISGLESALVQMHGCGRYTPEDVEELEENAWAALELLKAQEPCVMTLEEATTMPRYTICAVEQRSKILHTTFNAEYRGIVTIGGKEFLDFGLYADTNPYRRSTGGYGKNWRCWTSRPTDAQRGAIPWN